MNSATDDPNQSSAPDDQIAKSEPEARVPKSQPYWLLIALGCIVPAILDAFKSYMNSSISRQGPDWRDVIFAGTEWLFLGALTPIAYVLGRRFPLRRGTLARTTAIHGLGAFLLCIGWATLGVLLGRLLHRFPGVPPQLPNYIGWILISLPWSVFMYFTVLGCVYAFAYYREAREREAQEARLAAQLSEAKLGVLRMQLHPHFLFNSLNAITVLVRDQNTRDAARMLELLSGILRQVLRSDPHQEISLADELQFLEQYLAIEQVRFSDRLNVVWQIAPEAREALVPQFILQPLVENAIRHGIAKRSDPGTIEISARIENNNLILTVRDNGPGPTPVPGEGVGLTNTLARLETLFGGAAELEVGPAAEGGTVATVRIPFKL